MKILLCHNYYAVPGGEDQVFEDELKLLRDHGHNVHTVVKHNDKILHSKRTQMAKNAIWNPIVYRELNKVARSLKPDIVHFTNTFPIFSPSAYWAFQKHRIPVIQTLHNYRLVCPGSLLMRNDHFCNKCVGKSFAWPSVIHGCYRNSRMATTVTAMSNMVHTWLGTWEQKIDRYIALSEFSRQRFLEGGIPANKIVVKPNFVATPRFQEFQKSDYCIFVGRLAHEKGIEVLLDAWAQLKQPIELRIVGSGGLQSLVEQHAKNDSRIKFLGQLPHDQVMEQIARASAAIIPSLSVETFGRVVIEAFAVGTLVIASNVGAIAENIADGHAGILIEPGDVDALVTTISHVFDDEERSRKLTQNARDHFERRFTSKSNYEQLMTIYNDAIALKARRGVRLPAGNSIVRGDLPNIG